MGGTLLKVVVLASVTGVVGLACSASPQAVAVRWVALPPDAVAPAAARLQIAALLAPNPAGPWLLGGNTTTGEFPDAGIWVASDARVWTRAALRGLTLDAPQNLVFGVARRGGVSVAVGETPGMAHNNPRPTIWRSTTPASWAEVPTLREDFGGPKLTDLRAVVAGPTGFTVLGNWMTGDGRPVIAVWLSTDGLHWTREDHVAELTSRPGEELTADGLAAGPAGLAITGLAFDPTTAHPDRVLGFIAVSSDGRSWRRLDPMAAGLDDQGQVAVRQVAATTDGFVAVGTRAHGARNEVAAWTMTSTGRWTVTTLASSPLVLSTAVTSDGDTTWAVVGIDAGLRVWRSRRGGPWSAVDAPVAVHPQRVLIGAAGGLLLLTVQTATGVRVWVGGVSH